MVREREKQGKEREWEEMIETGRTVKKAIEGQGEREREIKERELKREN